MSVKELLVSWEELVKNKVPTFASFFCGLPDPQALKKALDESDIVVILMYRSFGKSARKVEWRRPKYPTYMDQYWRRVWVKVGDVDKNRIQVFCLPIRDIRSAPAVLKGLVNRQFKIQPVGEPFDVVGTEAWKPQPGSDVKFLSDVSQHELKKTDDETQLDTLKTMTDNYLRDK